MTGQKAQEFVMELYRTNNGCKLPCWWGITPGITSGIDAKRFLETFAMGLGEQHPGKGITYYYAALPSPKDVYGTFFSQDYRIVNGIVDSIFVHELFPSPIYNTISDFMYSIGPPEEIWVYANSGLFENYRPFEVMLFYPHKGILVSFFDSAVLVGNMLDGCPGGGSLFLWASGKEKSFEDWRYKFRWGSYNQLFISLEEATGMNVTTFYDKFKKPHSKICLRTPIEVWPTPGAVAEDWPTITAQPNTTPQP